MSLSLPSRAVGFVNTRQRVYGMHVPLASNQQPDWQAAAARRSSAGQLVLVFCTLLPHCRAGSAARVSTALAATMGPGRQQLLLPLLLPWHCTPEVQSPGTCPTKTHTIAAAKKAKLLKSAAAEFHACLPGALSR